MRDSWLDSPSIGHYEAGGAKTNYTTHNTDNVIDHKATIGPGESAAERLDRSAHSALRTHFNTSPAEYEALRDGYMGKRRFEIVRDALACCVPTANTVVEIGAGPGRLAAELAASFAATQFVAVDIDPRMFAYARAKHSLPNLNFLLADATGSLPDCEFMYSVDTLHHVEDARGCLRAAAHALSPGGSWLLLEPNIFNPLVFTSQERMRRAGFDEDHLRPWQVEPLMRQEGFTIAARRYAFMFPGDLPQIPPLLARVEKICERLPFVGGYVVYHLMRR
ncbi:MAG: class I SAM-dependent methyltransferase [Chloroflexota bacterium]